VLVLEHEEQDTGVVDGAPKLLEKSVVLGQNYPNPFNPETTLPVSLAHSGDYALEILNVRGRKVRSLQLPNQAAGDYLIRWNGNDTSGQALPSGYYLATLIDLSGRRSDTVKMLLLK